MTHDPRTEVLQHAANCWGKDGAGYEVREAVAELKAWTKGIGLALLLLQLLSAGGTVVKWVTPAVPAAQAQSQH